MSVIRHHADWLSLIESSGPFVSLPVLMRVFPQGLEPRDPAQAKALRAAYEEWHDNPTAPGQQQAWLVYVLTAVLGYPQELVTEGQSLPAGLEANMPEMGETLRPDFALVGPNGSGTGGQAQLLIVSYPVSQALDRSVIGKHWKATPATRMMELLHGAGVPLGLVTNGEQWMLVYAPRGETTGYTSWYGNLWLDEPITLRSFHSLLGVRRFFGVATDSTLVALLKESAQDQQEVTDQLGYQVREAVEVLVQSFDTLNRESGRTLLIGVTETNLYEAALTIMMRLVFLFSAEERGLLHLGKPLYDDNYAVSTLQEQLQEVADRYGEEVLERRLDAWARLLATFRAVHGGIQHQDLLMQAYGGSLFDPDRYPFLEGRAAGTFWHTTSAEPLSVNNRVVLHLLNSLQRLRTKVGTGATTETRRVSFRALGVEQIGHVYEGLLDHTAVRCTEPVLGIKGTRTKEPEILLSTLESMLAEGQDKLVDFLKDETGRSPSALRREMDGGGLLDEHKLLVACDQDEQLVARLRPFAGLIREDSFERPLVVLAGSVYVTTGTDRRSSGTHYTPPSLTEPIVQHTLEPLVYEGPAEGWQRDQWKLKSPKAILDIKVCDMAMGSGAFLVQTCRYLAERLVEAWENEEKLHPGEVLITPDGKFSEGAPSERLVPVDPNERIAIARRVVADRCLYGVDINPMAVEMAKLSLWLITVDANRPFTFIDHAFKCGDSLLGISSFDQLKIFTMRSNAGKQLGFSTINFWQHIEEATKKRESLEMMSSDTPEQVIAKAELYCEAEAEVSKLNYAADVLISVELMGLSDSAYETERENVIQKITALWSNDVIELKEFARLRLKGRRCLHWELAFPEVMNNGGFNAFVGNPPYMGGQKISGNFGSDYRRFLLDIIAKGIKGSADLSSYFLLRYSYLLNKLGCIGIVTTTAISEGDSRIVGLEQLICNNYTIYNTGESSMWSGNAGVIVATLHIINGSWNNKKILKGALVDNISSYLKDRNELSATPFKIKANSDIAFQGSTALGTGFSIDTEEADTLLKSNESYSNVVLPYLDGQDINLSFNHDPTRYTIFFRDWPISIENAPKGYQGQYASDYQDCLKILEERVMPERQKSKDEKARKDWWKFTRPRTQLYDRIEHLPHCFAIATQATKYIAFAKITKRVVFSNAVAVVASDSFSIFACISSNIHEIWARAFGSYNLALIRYSPSDLLETFPFPILTNRLDQIGRLYESKRYFVMSSRGIGLTDLYNNVHNQNEKSVDIEEIRYMQASVDNEVLEAYGWSDLILEHGFHETDQGVRFSISETARREVLGRLLTLNHKRHIEEENELASQTAVLSKKRGKKPKVNDNQMMMDL